jgi:N-acetylglucosamine-6-sulfatase
LDGDPPKNWRDAVLIESKPTKKDEHPYGLPGFRAVRTEARVYVRWDTGEKELYDLEADPYQLDNILAEERVRRNISDLAAVLEDLLDCAGQDCRAAEDMRP